MVRCFYCCAFQINIFNQRNFWQTYSGNITKESGHITIGAIHIAYGKAAAVIWAVKWGHFRNKILNADWHPRSFLTAKVDISSLFPELACCYTSAVGIYCQCTELILVTYYIRCFLCSVSFSPGWGFVAVIAFAPVANNFMCTVKNGISIFCECLIPYGGCGFRAVEPVCCSTRLELFCSQRCEAFDILRCSITVNTWTL